MWDKHEALVVREMILQNLTPKEMAEKTGESIETLYQWTKRYYNKLRLEHIEKEDETSEDPEEDNDIYAAIYDAVECIKEKSKRKSKERKNPVWHRVNGGAGYWK